MQVVLGGRLRHLLFSCFHGAMDVALASFHVILCHHLLRHVHFLRGSHFGLACPHCLNVGFERVDGALVAFGVVLFMRNRLRSAVCKDSQETYKSHENRISHGVSPFRGRGKGPWDHGRCLILTSIETGGESTASQPLRETSISRTQRGGH